MIVLLPRAIGAYQHIVLTEAQVGLLNAAEAAYGKSEELHRNQSPLTEASRARLSRTSAFIWNSSLRRLALGSTRRETVLYP